MNKFDQVSDLNIEEESSSIFDDDDEAYASIKSSIVKR